MPDIFGSVRRSLVLRSSNSSSSSSTRDEGREGSLVEKIGSCLRNSSLGILSKLQKPQTSAMGNGFPIRWRKGELIGCGAYGRVYMGMNLDSGELLAVKQVSIATKKGQREKAQGHILELEEEVKLLKNLSHPNIVRYLGTAREEENLNILLEFVPGGSISSLLGKFGSFPEPVIRKYTTQLLKGLEYLHRNKIIHRDIKGANILVDNKGCIKLTDFGASKKAVELATVSSTRSVKGTPYWMAPEVILQTGHSFPADIWSVGCTVIEMATGKPPWSEQYQEVAALFHIGTTKSHPPIPEHLSWEAKDFLLKLSIATYVCKQLPSLEGEPELRPAASDLLQHPFVTREYRDHHPILCPSLVPHQEHNPALFSASGSDSKNPSANTVAEPRATYRGLRVDCNVSNMKGTTTYSEELAKHGATSEASNSDDLCQIGIDDDHEVDGSLSPDNALALGPFSKSFNPISIPVDDWQCKFDESLEPRRLNLEGYGGSANGAADSSGAYAKRKDGIPFPSETSVSKDDDEVTESKIRAFLDETVMNLKKLQTPLCEEFYNTLNSAVDTSVDGVVYGDDATNDSKISSTSRSPPSRVASGTSTSLAAAEKSISPSSCRMRISSNSTSISDHILREIPVSQLIEQRELLESQEAPNSSSLSCSERQKKWKEELDQELETHREMRRASVVRKTSFPKDRGLKRPRDPSWDATPDR